MLLGLLSMAVGGSTAFTPSVPPTSPAGVPNQIWQWRGQQVRYQALGQTDAEQAVVLVHGLFVNADHWRRNIDALAKAGLRVYSLDLLGYGYCSKPDPYGEVAASLNGENGRDLGEPEVELGTSWGGRRTVRVAMTHPLGSAYNFYTWSEQLCDFIEQVVDADHTTLVCNSIGSISGLQAAIDRSDLIKGVFIANPNFRELHVSEQLPILVPFVQGVQALLRDTPLGANLFKALAKPETVKQILKEPYYDETQVTDELVDVLLSPLLTEGADRIVFDTLSYSAGPLPEQLLQDPRLTVPVWVCWGEKDPWTPAPRVRALDRYPSVRRVIPIPGVGHCPHDEAPQLVNPLIEEFVQELFTETKFPSAASISS